MNTNHEVTIGELIVLLKNCQQDADIRFDFPGYARPTRISSYRGYYNMPAMEFTTRPIEQDITVADIVKVLEESIDGRTFEGWKGGSYRYTKDQPIFVANRGDTSDVKIVGVADEGYRVVLRTEYHPS